ncbi:hypothetical protein C8034_v007763 [Colletotrichum sidae]|uniref:Uncharacterized protein n=1 Tax=Colletotrichum sidae TaxID=1347389 RepID=A0A4R8TTE9_9PEZI|nr:hypothetical protein C8034_v007763 [Colletotrichum sidae]
MVWLDDVHLDDGGERRDRTPMTEEKLEEKRMDDRRRTTDDGGEQRDEFPMMKRLEEKKMDVGR